MRQANATPTLSAQPPSPPGPLVIGPEFAAAVVLAVTQALAQNPSPPAPPVASPLQAKSSSTFLSEKLPDISEYDGERDRLDAWEQSLLQKMTANDDRFPDERNKIAYAESRLTIEKKAHSLMGQYRKDGICTLPTLAVWRQKLRNLCGNPFEEEDARTYPRDELKQGSMPFHEYYHKFCQKKERSRMDDPSLLDCLKHNVNYGTQVSAFNWRDEYGHRPVSFDDHVKAYAECDANLAQLKHRQPKSTTGINPTSITRSKPSPSQSAPLAGSKSAAAVPVVAVTPALAVALAGDPMDMSSAIAAIQRKSLSVPGVKDICNKWQLCYYCKLQHPGKTAKECPNKKPVNLPAADLDNATSSDGGVPLPSGNA